jgi:hypothetical protein
MIMKRSHFILLQCLLLLKVLFQSKGISAKRKPPTSRIDRSREDVDAKYRRLPKKNHEARFTFLNNKKKQKLNTNIIPISSAPSTSMHPTPVIYQYDDDSYFNRTMTPSKSPVQTNKYPSQMLMRTMPPDTLSPSIIPFKFPNATSSPIAKNSSAAMIQAVINSNSSTLAPTQMTSSLPSTAPSLFPSGYPSATPTKVIAIARKCRDKILISCICMLQY